MLPATLRTLQYQYTMYKLNWLKIHAILGIDIHVPYFNEMAYLQFIGLRRTVLSFAEIEIVFKAEAANGLILYNGYTTDRSGDFISVALKDQYLEFRFDLGTGPAVIR